MMIWMAVDIDVHSNGKVLALAERLDVSADEAVGIMVRLWAHAMRNSDRTGKLRHSSPAVFAEVFRQPRDRAKDIMQLLVELELLDESNGSYFVHGWDERQAAWYSFLEKKDYNKQNYRTRRKTKNADSGQIQSRISLDSDNNQTVPNQTLPYPTVPNNTEQDPGRGGAPSPPVPQAPESPIPPALHPPIRNAAAPGGPPVSKKTNPWKDGTLIDDVYGLYAELCPSLPKLLKPTQARRMAVLHALKHKGVSVLYDAFKKAGETPFLNGANQRGWKADFDWLTKGDNMLRVLEGRYDRSANCTDDRDMDRNFGNQHTYTKEQFAAMTASAIDTA
jgi:hypothetical protein